MSDWHLPIDSFSLNRLALDEIQVTAELGFLTSRDMKGKPAFHPASAPDDVLVLKAECEKLKESLRKSENARYTIETANGSTAAAALLAQKNFDVAEKRRVTLSEQIKSLKERLADADSRASSFAESDAEKKRTIESQAAEINLVRKQLQQANTKLDLALSDLATANLKCDQLTQALEETRAALEKTKGLQDRHASADAHVASLLAVNDDMKRTLEKQAAEARRTQQQLQHTQFEQNKISIELEAQKVKVRHLEGVQQRSSAPQNSRQDSDDGRIASLLTVKDDMQKTLDRQEYEKNDLMRKLQNKEQSLQNTESKLSTTFAELCISQAKCEQLAQSLQRTEQLLQLSESKNSATFAELCVSQAKCEQISQSLQFVQSVTARPNHHLQRDGNGHPSLEAQIASMHNVALEIKRTNENLMVENAILKQQLSDASQIQQRLEEKYDSARSSISGEKITANRLRQSLQQSEAARIAMEYSVTSPKNETAVQNQTSLLWHQIQELTAQKNASESRIVTLLDLQQDMEHAIDQQASQARLHADQIDLISSHADFLSNHINNIAMMKNALEMRLSEVEMAHEELKSQLIEEKKKSMVHKVVGFLRLWKNISINRAWKKWCMCTFRSQRRNRLMLFGLRKLRGSALDHAFETWAQVFADERLKAEIHQQDDAHAMAVERLKQESEARVQVLFDTQRQLLADVQEQQHLMNMKILEGETSRAVARALSFIRFWKQSAVSHTWKMWSSWACNRGTLRRRFRPLLAHLLSNQLKRALIRSWWVWDEHVQVAKHDAYNRYLAAKIQETVPFETVLVSQGATPPDQQSQIEEYISKFLVVKSNLEVLAARAKDDRDEVMTNIIYGRARSFVRHWKKCSILGAWNKWRDWSSARAGTKRRHYHLLRIRQRSVIGGVVSTSWQLWITLVKDNERLREVELTRKDNELRESARAAAHAQITSLLSVQEELERTIETQASEATVLVQKIEDISNHMKQSSVGVWVLKDNLDLRLAASHRVHETLRAENARLLQSIGEARHEHEKQIQSMVDRLNRSFDENLALKQRLDHVLESEQHEIDMKGSLEKSTSILRKELDSSQEENRNLVKGIDALRQDNERHLQALMSITNELWQVKNCLESKLADSEQEKGILAEELKSERAKCCQLLDRIDTCRKISDESVASKKNLEKKVAESEEEKILLMAKLDEARKTIREGRILLNTSKSVQPPEYSPKRAPVHDMNDEDLRSEIFERRIAGLNETIQAQEAQISALSGLQQELERSLDEETSSSKILHGQVASLSEKIETAFREKLEAESRLEEMSTMFKTMDNQQGPKGKILHLAASLEDDGNSENEGVKHHFVLEQLRMSQHELRELGRRLEQPSDEKPQVLLSRLALQSAEMDLVAWKSEVDILRLESKLECIPDRLYDISGRGGSQV